MLFALSNAELGLFLDDLGRTVGDPADRTDFRKVLFYLFGFTHVRLLEASRRRDDDTALTARLVAGIELVLVRHKHLLNVEVTQEEWRGLGITQSLGWAHYETHAPEPHILLFKRPINYQ